MTRWLPAQTLHGPAQRVQDRLLSRLRHAARAPVLGGRTGGLAATLRAGVQVQVGEQARPEPGAAGHQARGQVDRDAVDEVAQHQPAARVAVGDQRQRRQEVLAELAVGGPGLGWITLLEGEGVDQDRPAGIELDVVGAGVLEAHPGGKRPTLQLEGEQRGITQLAEAPFVGVGDQRQLARPQYGHRIG